MTQVAREEEMLETGRGEDGVDVGVTVYEVLGEHSECSPYT